MARTQSQDTHPEAERRHIDLLRQAGLAKRLEMSARLTRSTFALSLRNLASQNPGWDEQRCRLELVEQLYGARLAQGVRSRLGGQ